jgi:protein SCO1/2
MKDLPLQLVLVQKNFKTMWRVLALPLFICFLIAGCTPQPKQLPVLGNSVINGNDTVYPAIADFSFINQDSSTVSNQTFSDKVYVADFIFLSCPTICPVMAIEMKKVYAAYQNDERVLFLSHTIDPQHDTVPRLKAYAKGLNVSSPKWHFVTGNQESILKIAEQSYFSTAYPDSSSPGGFTHSGGLLLIDKNRHIRGVYNSTKTAETERLIKDIDILLKEQF